MYHKSIIIKCDGFPQSHMRLSYQVGGLKVEHGSPDVEVRNGIARPKSPFIVKSSEKLTFKDNPELSCLHDGHGWLIPELADFVTLVL